jgi:hypothetical protein
MKLLPILAMLSLVTQLSLQAQTNDMPYRNIPNHPEIYTEGAIAARMIDGLGFRFYWATESLTEADLNFQPSEGARTTLQTMQHIFDLSVMIRNAALQEVNKPISTADLSYLELRQQTLQHFKVAADILRVSTNLSPHAIKFANRETPFWFMINGPISDAIWHCGQLASFRRAAGNPISSDISFFSGTVKN